MYVIIVGGGNLGEGLAKVLIAEKQDVVIVENDEERANELADALDALVIKGDGTDVEKLGDAGIEKADALVAITGDDKVNLMVAEIAKKNHVRFISARVNDPKNNDLFLQAGVGAAISTTSAAITSFRNSLVSVGEKSILVLADGKAELVQIYLPEHARAIGRQVSGAKIPEDASIAMIQRGGEVIIPKPETDLQTGDVLFVLTKTELADDVQKALVG